MKLDRRQALGLLGAAGAATAGPASAAVRATFRHGVAAGDPSQDGLVLWTRVTPDEAGADNTSLRYAVAKASRPTRKVKQGLAFTGAARDFTVKVEVTGLDAGEEYVYWFEAGPVKSPVGRARTLPEGETPDLVLAVASCALWAGGNFNAYEAIARQPRVDAVLHLGDYIYEFGRDGFGAEIGTKIGRLVDPPTECLTLDDYRRRHAQSKTDPQLQAAHARAAWIVVWDDHETANDAWMGGAENHQPDTEGAWTDRRDAAIRAWYEWMPIRDPQAGRSFEAVNRSFHFGDLASLIMLETRLMSRARILDYAADLPVVDGKPDIPAFMAKWRDPARELMGERQQEWLEGELTASVNAGRRWQLLGNQVVMARVVMPNLMEAVGGQEAFGQFLAGLPDYAQGPARDSIGVAMMGLPYSLDTWDGFPAARERLYEACKAAGATPIVLSGDSHAFWANELWDGSGQTRVAAEFGATGISSPGYGVILNGVNVNPAFEALNKEVVYTDHNANGFVLVTLTREKAKAEMVAVSTVYAPQYEVKVLRAFEVRPAEVGVGEVTAVP